MFKPYCYSEIGYINSLENIPENFRIDKNKTCLKILTETGMELVIDKEASLKLLNPNGKFEFKKANDLKVGDISVSSLKNFLFNNESCIENKKAYMIGLLYSYKIYENNSIFSLVRNSVFDYIGEFLYRYFEFKKERDIYTFIVHQDFINKNNILLDTVPKFIFEGNKESQIYFLKGFFDTNSLIYENKIIKDIYDNTLLQQINLMLRNLGIIAEIDNYDLIISGQEIISYYNLIGTMNLDYEEEMLNINLTESDFYEIENLKGICKNFFETTDKLNIDLDNFKFTRTNILKLLQKDGDKEIKLQIENVLFDNVCFDKIISIEEVNVDYLVMKTCDVDVYIMNGFYIKK